MPFVSISLRTGTSAEYRRAIADGVHQAMVEAIAIPADDRFQVISEYSAENLIYDSQYLGVQRSDRVVLIQITLSAGRKPAQKRALYEWSRCPWANLNCAFMPNGFAWASFSSLAT